MRLVVGMVQALCGDWSSARLRELTQLHGRRFGLNEMEPMALHWDLNGTRHAPCHTSIPTSTLSYPLMLHIATHGMVSDAECHADMRSGYIFVLSSIRHQAPSTQLRYKYTLVYPGMRWMHIPLQTRRCLILMCCSSESLVGSART
jgi:hypothetical protein